MTTEDLDLLLAVKDRFYTGFSKLVAKHLDMVPPRHHEYLKVLLQETSSVYGSDYESYLKKGRSS